MKKDEERSRTAAEGPAQSFHQRGFAVVRGLLSSEQVEAMRRCVGEAGSLGHSRMAGWKTGFLSDFARELLACEGFRSVVGSLYPGQDLLVLDQQHFSIDERSQGFAWHYGAGSYSLLPADGHGFTLWMPCDPIEPEGQGGGVALLDTRIANARDFYGLGWRIVQHEEVVRGASVTDASAGFLGDFLVGEKVVELFEREATLPGLGPGDALLFHKNVFHRSEPLRPGPMATRGAAALRFIVADSPYDREQDRATQERLHQELGKAYRFIEIAAGRYLYDLLEDQAPIGDHPAFAELIQRFS